MSTERKKSAIEKFASTYFSNFGKFTAANLIFALPLAIAFCLCFLLCKYLFPYPTVVLPFTLVLASPFYPGVVVVSKKIFYDELSLSVFSEYILAVKDNFRAFILHGFLAYVAFVGCYHGIVIYKSFLALSPVFYVMLFVSIFLAVFLLFFFYGLPMMTAFFDLKLKDAYKNSLLMTFGELKANFFATIGITAYLLVLSLPVMILGLLSAIWGEVAAVYSIFAYIILAVLLLVPSGVSGIIITFVYPDMKRVISGEAQRNIEAIRKEEAQEEVKEAMREEIRSSDFSDIDISSLEKTSGEYIFYNGKMIKKSVILQELKEREEK